MVFVKSQKVTKNCISLQVRANYKQLCNSIVAQFFKTSPDIIVVAMAMCQLHKNDL